MAESWDVFVLGPGGDYEQPEYLATLYNASQQSIIVELDNTGSGSFAINREAPECTEAILAQGNLVKVRIPEISADYIFAFFLETGDFTLISSEEVGGEQLTFGGRGIFSYLEYACAWSESYITGGDSPDAGVWRAYAAGTGSAPGQILRRMIEEMQDPDRPQQPLPLLAIDFDYDDDSTADPWNETDATDEFAYQVGETGLAIAQRLIDTDTIVMQMSPDFLLSAYNPANFGRDLAALAFGAGVVRFERGVNIATELRRELVVKEASTHMLVGGENDHYARAVWPGASLLPTREAFVASFGVGATALVGVGAAELAKRHNISDQIMFPINNRRTQAVVLVDPVSAGAVASSPGIADDGYYLPGPEGTNGDFWVGDTIRVHTGSGPFDYNEVDAQVHSITITRRDDNAELDIIVDVRTFPASSDHLLSFLAQRAGSATGSGVYPRGYSGATPVTNWSKLGNGYARVPGDYPFDVAYRSGFDSATEPLVNVWANVALNGTSRPTCFSVQIEGATGPIVLLDQLDGQFGSFSSDFIGPTVTIPEDGWLIGYFSALIRNDTNYFYFIPPGGVTELYQAKAEGNTGDAGFSPNSTVVYKPVTTGSTSITLGHTVAHGTDVHEEWGCMMLFIPGTDLSVVQQKLAGATGGSVQWTWDSPP